MLVLTRQKNESIMIGDDIEVTLLEVRGDKVRLGIRAPADVRVFRKEIYEAIEAENLAASQAAEADLKRIEQLLSHDSDPTGS